MPTTVRPRFVLDTLQHAANTKAKAKAKPIKKKPKVLKVARAVPMDDCECSGSEEENIAPTKRNGTQTRNSKGNSRSTRREVTYAAVEKRLRDAGLWKQGVAFHDQLDKHESKDPAFAAHRELARMHIEADGRVTTRPDGTECASSALEPCFEHFPRSLPSKGAPAQLRTRTDQSTKSRPKAPSGFEANQAEYDAAKAGKHPVFFRFMEEYGYEEVLSFVQQKNKSWLAGDLSRFFVVRPPTAGHTRRIPCLAEPVTCDVAAPDAALPHKAGARHVQRDGAFHKAKCAYGVRAQLKAETGEVRALAPTPLAHPHIPYSVPPPTRLCIS